MAVNTFPPVRFLAVDFMRGLAVIIMFLPHVIYQIHIFQEYSGIQHIAQVGLRFLAQGGFAFAGVFFFTLVGLSFFISVANKPAKNFFKHKMIAGISLLFIQEIISVGFFNGDMGLLGQYINNAQIFENTFHILNLIGWATIILTLLFCIGLKNPNTYLLIALILILLNPFNHIVSEKFKAILMILAPVPVVNYLANALFSSGCSIFANLPSIFFGVYLGDFILTHYDHKLIDNQKTTSMSTLLMFACSFIMFLWIIGIYNNDNILKFLIQFYLYALIYYLYIIINYIINEKHSGPCESYNVQMRFNIDRIAIFFRYIKIENVFILFGIYALPVYVYHWDIISKILKPISSVRLLPITPIATYIYLFSFITVFFLIIRIYSLKLRNISMVKLLYYYLYQYRLLVFSFGAAFAFFSFVTKLYLAYGIGPKILIYNCPFYYLLKYISLAFLIYFLRNPKAVLINTNANV